MNPRTLCAFAMAGGAALTACSGDGQPDALPSVGAGTGAGGDGTGAAPQAGSGGDGGSSGGSGGSGDAGSGGVGVGGSSGGAGGSSGGTASGAGGGPSHPVGVGCDLPDAAFCDAFTKPSPGGRAGALDDAHWSLSRLGFGCAYTFRVSRDARQPVRRLADRAARRPDSEFCVNEDNEPRWAEGFDDNTDFNYLSAADPAAVRLRGPHRHRPMAGRRADVRQPRLVDRDVDHRRSRVPDPICTIPISS